VARGRSRIDDGMAPRSAGDAVALDEAMIVAGIGSRSGVAAGEVLAAVIEALRLQDLPASALSALATGHSKSAEPGILAAARALGLEVIVVDQAALEATMPRTLTCSDRSLAATGTR